MMKRFCLVFAALALPLHLHAQELAPLRVDSSGRFLQTSDGAPFFPSVDTAWKLAYGLDRSEVAHYLDTRRAQGFNTVALVAFDMDAPLPNVYGDEAFRRDGATWDPARPRTTPGNDPADSAAYDHWDHLDYVIDAAAERDLRVILLPAWGLWTVGSYDNADTSKVIFDEANAYAYGRWLGARYGSRSHVIWMLGGDRAAVYGERDYRPVFRALAEGLADGTNGEGAYDGRADYASTLISFHPQKQHPNSSVWLHGDDWLDFNSVQAHTQTQNAALALDYGLRPTKPTWLFEGRYERAPKDGFEPKDWDAAAVRHQAYQTVLGGGFGHTYGHANVWRFGEGWRDDLRDPGAEDMRHLLTLMDVLKPEEQAERVPDQRLIVGDVGATDRVHSDRIQAARGQRGTYALVYTANGRDVTLDLGRLADGGLSAYWFNPREGTWHAGGEAHEARTPFAEGVQAGPGTDVRTFDPPGEPGRGNDWVLVLLPR